MGRAYRREKLASPGDGREQWVGAGIPSGTPGHLCGKEQVQVGVAAFLC